MSLAFAKEPLVSVIVPIYNMEKLLDRCLQSILNQNYPHLEIILVDDGSQDSSLSICNDYKEKDKRIFVFHEINQGSGPARNLGMQNSHGQFITFVDPDDWLPLNSISLLLFKQKQSDFDFVIGDCLDCFNNQKKKMTQSIKNFSLISKTDCENNFWDILNKDLLNSPWKKLYKSSLIINNKLSFPDLRRSQDLFFNLDYYNCISSIAYFDEIVYFYSTNPKTLILKLPIDYYKTIIRYYEQVKCLTKAWKISDNKINTSNFCTRLLGLIDASISSNYLLNASNEPIINSRQIREIVLCSTPKGLFKKLLKRAILAKKIKQINSLMKIKKIIKY